MSPVEKFLAYGILILLPAFTIPLYAEDKPYAIVDGKVDENTFQGWQIYQENCGRCHGDSGQGIGVPSLGEVMKVLSREQFVDSVTRGKGLMPPMRTNQKVVDNIDKIYAYLKARSDDALGPGKLER